MILWSQKYQRTNSQTNCIKNRTTWGSQVDYDAYIAGIVYCLPGNDNNGVQVHANTHVAPLSESW